MNKLSDITFVLAVAVAIIAVARIVWSRINLPAGVCPIDDGRSFLFVALALSVASLITSFLKR